MSPEGGLDLVRRGVPGAGLARRVQDRALGRYEVDDWGLDPDVVDLVDPLFSLRWDITVVGAEQIPRVGGAVLVYNRRLGLSEGWVVARGIRRECGRYVRTVGVPDVDPFGTVLRRFGGVLDRTDEIAGLLRNGQLVGMPTARSYWSREAVGAVTVHRLEAAVATGSPVIPVAAVGRETGRVWKVVVGKPVDPPRRAGPLAAAELAEATRSTCQVLLDEALPGWWF